MLTRDKIKGFILSPLVTFEKVKEESVDEAIRYYFSLLVIYTVIASIIYFITDYKNEPMLLFFSMLGLIAGGLLILIIGAAWLHLWIVLLGGKGYTKTVKVIAYARTPQLLFGWISILPSLLMHNFIISRILDLLLEGIFLAWVFALTVIGVREIHEFTTSKALLSVIISLIPLILLITISILVGIWIISQFLFP